MTEFNLSEEEKTIGYDKLDKFQRVYAKEKLKEFIRRLKERILYRHSGGHSSVSDVCNEEIDKLAGDKLNGK